VSIGVQVAFLKKFAKLETFRPLLISVSRTLRLAAKSPEARTGQMILLTDGSSIKIPRISQPSAPVAPVRICRF
jgi:hypothetical protein